MDLVRPTNLSKPGVVNTKWYNLTALTLTPTILSLPPYGFKGYRSAQHYNLNSLWGVGDSQGNTVPQGVHRYCDIPI